MGKGEIHFWKFEDGLHPWELDTTNLDLDWGGWLIQLFHHPTIEILILHKLRKDNILSLDLASDIQTPLKELCIGLENIGPEFLASLMRIPKALERFELCESSSWSEPEMEDVSLWVDAIRCQRESLVRLALQPMLRKTGPLILDDFPTLKYLSINHEYLMHEIRSRPPHIETIEVLHRTRHIPYNYLVDADDVEEVDDPWNCILALYLQGIWPALGICVVVYDNLIIPSNWTMPSGVTVKRRYKHNLHQWVLQDRSDRFSWESSWLTPLSIKCGVCEDLGSRCRNCA